MYLYKSNGPSICIHIEKGYLILTCTEIEVCLHSYSLSIYMSHYSRIGSTDVLLKYFYLKSGMKRAVKPALSMVEWEASCERVGLIYLICTILLSVRQQLINQTEQGMPMIKKSSFYIEGLKDMSNSLKIEYYEDILIVRVNTSKLSICQLDF